MAALDGLLAVLVGALFTEAADSRKLLRLGDL
jgi:hypothetical protein